MFIKALLYTCGAGLGYLPGTTQLQIEALCIQPSRALVRMPNMLILWAALMPAPCKFALLRGRMNATC